MKNQMKLAFQSKTVCMLITLMLFMICPACEDPSSENNHIIINHKDALTIGPEGGTFHALNKNVSLKVPNGSLQQEIQMTIEEGPIDYDGDFVIKSIEISPHDMFFKNPLGLRLKYNGQLDCGNDLCKTKDLVIYHFNSDKEFDVRKPTDMWWIAKCYLNQMDCCIETEIQIGGIYAIGEASIGQPAIFHH